MLQVYRFSTEESEAGGSPFQARVLIPKETPAALGVVIKCCLVFLSPTRLCYKRTRVKTSLNRNTNESSVLNLNSTTSVARGGPPGLQSEFTP